MVLTDAGADLLPHAPAMRKAMSSLRLAAAGRETSLAGSVRIIASMLSSHCVLPPNLARIPQAETAIQIDLLPSDATQNLLFRAADIAFHMYRPTQLDVVIQHVTDVSIGTFAAKSYLG